MSFRPFDSFLSFIMWSVTHSHNYRPDFVHGPGPQMALGRSLGLGSLERYDVADIDLLTVIAKMTEPNHPLGVH